MSKAALTVDCLSFNIEIVEDDLRELADSETRFVKRELRDIVIAGRDAAKAGYDRAIIAQGSGDVVDASGEMQTGPGRRKVAPRRDQGEKIRFVKRLSEGLGEHPDYISVSGAGFGDGDEFGYDLKASGRALFFYEFGIGYFVDAGEGDYATQARRQGASIKSGSWSKTRHINQFGEQTPGPFWLHGLWHYRGKIYHGVQGVHAMYEAEKLMSNKIDKLIAKRT